MDFEQLRQMRNKSRFAQLIHLEVTRIEEGYAEAEMPVTEETRNGIGILHGGCLYTAADVAAGAASASRGGTSVTLNADFHYLRAGTECTRLRAAARELKNGRRTRLYQVSVYDQNETLMAEGTFTYFCIE